MRPNGSFRIASRDRAFDAYEDPALRGIRRVGRILDSLRREILEGGDGSCVRVRQIFSHPREIYRLEIVLPELGYQRTTLMDADALEELLEWDEVRDRISVSLSDS